MLLRKLLAIVAIVIAASVLLTACPKPPGQSTQPPTSSTQAAKPAPRPQPSTPPATTTPAETPAKPTTAETPLEPENNQPGDIPDTQAFVIYESPQGMYSLKVPEGWARTESGMDVVFVDKFDGEQVKVTTADKIPTIDSVKQTQVPELEKSGRAVKITEVKTLKMPDGFEAVVVIYTANSEPDPVTAKQMRCDYVTYYYYMPGMLAAMTLWAPTGADNVDQWKVISESFKWKK